MDIPDKNQINYWAGGESYEHLNPKPKRSIKKKLSIVFSFIFVLAVTPSLIYAFMNLDFNKGREVSVVSLETHAPIQNSSLTPEVHRVFIEEPKPEKNETAIINNDSYWKITKRVCGEGKYYLDIQKQNNSKALFAGESVMVACPSY